MYFLVANLLKNLLEKLKHAKGVKHDTDLTAFDLKEQVVEQYNNFYLETKGENFASGTKYDTKNLFLFHSFLR